MVYNVPPDLACFTSRTTFASAPDTVNIGIPSTSQACALISFPEVFLLQERNLEVFLLQERNLERLPSTSSHGLPFLIKISPEVIFLEKSSITIVSKSHYHSIMLCLSRLIISILTFFIYI